MFSCRLIYLSTRDGDTHFYEVIEGVSKRKVLSSVIFNLLLVRRRGKLPDTADISVYADDICM